MAAAILLSWVFQRTNEYDKRIGSVIQRKWKFNENAKCRTIPSYTTLLTYTRDEIVVISSAKLLCYYLNEGRRK